MDISKPYTAICSAATGDVLRVLAGTNSGVSGRGIARLASYQSHTSVLTALEKLVSSGIVNQQEIGGGSLYFLNTDHVAMPAVYGLLQMRNTLLQRVRDEITTWKIEPEKVTLFGSMARGDGDSDSDIDFLIIAPTDISDKQRESWEQQLDHLSRKVRQWSGNRAGIVELTETDWDRLEEKRPELWASVRTDSIELFGSTSGVIGGMEYI